MSQMKRLLAEVIPERWRVLPVLEQHGERHHVPTGDYRLMENIAADGNHLWVERRRGSMGAMQGLADDHNKEDYITPASVKDATDRAALRTMDKWKSNLELAKCTLTSKLKSQETQSSMKSLTGSLEPSSD